MRLRPASILLIDHDPEIADRLRQLQPADNRYSYTLEFADNLEVGLQRLAGGGFDLLILGLSLPEAPGLEACQRARGQALDVPLVVLTDRAGESTAVMAVENGAQDYLIKEQLQPDLLVRVIRNVMAYGQAQEALRKAYGELEERTLELERTNAHLRQNIAEHEQIEQYLATIYQLGWELAKLRSDSDIARRVLEIAQQEFGIERASLALVDNVSNQLEYRYRMVDGLVEPFQLCLPLGARNARGIGTFVAKSGQLLNVSDTAGDPRYVPDPEGWSGRSELCVPMRLGQRIIGVLNAESLELDRFTLVDQQLFQALADQTAVALENVRLYRETRNRERELAGLNQAGRTMASTLNLDAVLQQVMAEAKTMLTAEGVAVLLTEPAIDELVFAAVASPSAEIMIGTPVPLENSIAGWVVREKKPTLIRDAQRDERFYDHIDSITGLTTHSVLAVPLIFGGKVTGVIEATNKVTGSFNLHDLGLLEALASSAAIAIENARLYQELQDKMLALQEAQIQLVQQEKMAALGRLSSSITHEINNPLQAIQNSLALLEDEVGDEQRTKKLDQYLGIARDEIDRISAIMYRMRSFYSGVHGQRLRETADSDTIDDFYRSTNQELQSIDLHQLLEHILQLVGNQLEDKAVTVERKWAVDMPVICGNPDHLKQVFLNLMLNAIDAMSGTGGTLYLSTELDLVQPDESQPQQVALVEFSDTGVGISPENLSQVFEPFFSTKEAGSGLGLSICYKIIRAHEGQIGVESQLGLGTTFTVKLPVSSAEG